MKSGTTPRHQSSYFSSNANDAAVSISQSVACNQSANYIVASVRQFLGGRHSIPYNRRVYTTNKYCEAKQQPQHFCNSSSQAQDSPIWNSNVKLPLFKLSNFGVWNTTELGRGFSGVVYRGVGILLSDDESDVKDFRSIAIKLSKPRSTSFKNEACNGREFETLKFLYVNHVPVPRPLGFCISADDSGNGRSLLMMEIIDGFTLREWINNQSEQVLKHEATGRTLHPAKSFQAAIDRLDIAIGLITALIKLHQYGVFVDLKPRNVMIGREKAWVEEFGEGVSYEKWCPKNSNRRFTHSVTLVDVGGVVLRKDLSEADKNKSVDQMECCQTSINENCSSLTPSANCQTM